MKKITLIWMFSLCMNWVLNPAFGVEYATDFLEQGNPGGWSVSLKTFDEHVTADPGERIDADIWLTNPPAQIITAGFFVDYDASKVALISSAFFDGSLPGPWDAGMTNITENPSGPGTYMAVVGNLSNILPDADGDIIIARITFECTSPGDASVTFRPVPGFDTIVSDSAIVYDSQMATHTIVISQQQGTSLTTSSSSTSTIPPVTTTTSIIPACAMYADCPDDGLYCNGEEFCDEAGAVCMSTGNPCAAGLVCDEDADECKPTASPLTLQLTPEAWYQSLWVPLIKFLRIEGSGTHFARSVTKITLAPASAALMLPLVIDETTINCVGILLPGWLAPVDAIDVTVTTGEEEATASMEIKLLPFLLEQKGNALWDERF